MQLLILNVLPYHKKIKLNTFIRGGISQKIWKKVKSMIREMQKYTKVYVIWFHSQSKGKWSKDKIVLRMLEFIFLFSEIRIWRLGFNRKTFNWNSFSRRFFHCMLLFSIVYNSIRTAHTHTHTHKMTQTKRK